MRHKNPLFRLKDSISSPQQPWPKFWWSYTVHFKSMDWLSMSDARSSSSAAAAVCQSVSQSVHRFLRYYMGAKKIGVETSYGCCGEVIERQPGHQCSIPLSRTKDLISSPQKPWPNFWWSYTVHFNSMDWLSPHHNSPYQSFGSPKQYISNPWTDNQANNAQSLCSDQKTQYPQHNSPDQTFGDPIQYISTRWTGCQCLTPPAPPTTPPSWKKIGLDRP